jgi:hypothetical protein
MRWCKKIRMYLEHKIPLKNEDGSDVSEDDTKWNRTKDLNIWDISELT